MTDTKQTPKKKPSPEPSSAEYRAMDNQAVALLHEQPKVRIRAYQIPEDSSDEKLPDLTVAINGHVYQIKRGVTVEVPEEVANILSEAGHV